MRVLTTIYSLGIAFFVRLIRLPQLLAIGCLKKSEYIITLLFERQFLISDKQKLGKKKWSGEALMKNCGGLSGPTRGDDRIRESAPFRPALPPGASLSYPIKSSYTSCIEKRLFQS